jgi:ketosteroid isomerase-like protein
MDTVRCATGCGWKVMAMAVQDNVQRVKDAYVAFGRGDIAGVMRDMADDIEWVIPGPADTGVAGTFRGKQAVQGWFGAFGQTISFQRFEPYEFIAQGDKVVALLHAEGTALGTNQRFTDEVAHVFTYRDGTIVHFQTFNDTAAGATAIRGSK